MANYLSIFHYSLNGPMSIYTKSIDYYSGRTTPARDIWHITCIYNVVKRLQVRYKEKKVKKSNRREFIHLQLHLCRTAKPSQAGFFMRINVSCGKGGQQWLCPARESLCKNFRSEPGKGDRKMRSRCAEINTRFRELLRK